MVVEGVTVVVVTFPTAGAAVVVVTLPTAGAAVVVVTLPTAGAAVVVVTLPTAGAAVVVVTLSTAGAVVVVSPPAAIVVEVYVGSWSPFPVKFCPASIPVIVAVASALMVSAPIL